MDCLWHFIGYYDIKSNPLGFKKNQSICFVKSWCVPIIRLQENNMNPLDEYQKDLIFDHLLPELPVTSHSNLFHYLQEALWWRFKPQACRSQLIIRQIGLGRKLWLCYSNCSFSSNFSYFFLKPSYYFDIYLQKGE